MRDETQRERACDSAPRSDLNRRGRLSLIHVMNGRMQIRIRAIRRRARHADSQLPTGRRDGLAGCRGRPRL